VLAALKRNSSAFCRNQTKILWLPIPWLRYLSRSMPKYRTTLPVRPTEAAHLRFQSANISNRLHYSSVRNSRWSPEDVRWWWQIIRTNWPSLLPNLCGQQKSAVSRETDHYAPLTSVNRWMNLHPTRQRACSYTTRSAHSVLHSSAANISKIRYRTCFPCVWMGIRDKGARNMVPNLKHRNVHCHVRKMIAFDSTRPCQTLPCHISSSFPLI
jgi:hypothetical protein